jgi:hypothetical protein
MSAANRRPAADGAHIAALRNTQDLRSPDARDTASGRGTFTVPRVTVVKVAQPSQFTSGGFDWGDAGIGAGGVLALVLIAVGGSLVVTHRRPGGPAISCHGSAAGRGAASPCRARPFPGSAR